MGISKRKTREKTNQNHLKSVPKWDRCRFLWTYSPTISAEEPISGLFHLPFGFLLLQAQLGLGVFFIV